MSGRKARFTKVEVRRILEAAREVSPNIAVELTADGVVRFSPAVEKPTQDMGPRRRIVF